MAALMNTDTPPAAPKQRGWWRLPHGRSWPYAMAIVLMLSSVAMAFKNDTNTMRPITEIIIHCSATREGQDFTAADIRRWHVDGNGWSDIGYHFVIRLDGTIELGRPLDKVGAHCSGHNQYSIGVCYIGGLDSNLNPKDTRTPEQKAAMAELIGVLRRIFPAATVHGHNEYARKSCPCFWVDPGPRSPQPPFRGRTGG